MAGANLAEADLREGSYATYDPDKGLTFTSDSEAWQEGTGGVDMRGANLGSVKLSGAIAINSNLKMPTFPNPPLFAATSKGQSGRR